MLDMGLCPCEGDFGVLTDEEYDDRMMEAEENDETLVKISADQSEYEEAVEGVLAAEEGEVNMLR